MIPKKLRDRSLFMARGSEEYEGAISIFEFTKGLDEIHNQPRGQSLLFKNKIRDFWRRNPLSIQQNVFYKLQMELFLTK